MTAGRAAARTAALRAAAARDGGVKGDGGLVIVSGGSRAYAALPYLAELQRAWTRARYYDLAHAALALAAAIDPAANPRERAALDLIATHARKYSVRLRATDPRAFTKTWQAGRYEDGRPQAEKGSRVVEQDYRTWVKTGSPLEAARDPVATPTAHFLATWP